MIHNFEELLSTALGVGRKRIAVIYPNNEETFSLSARYARPVSRNSCSSGMRRR